LAFSRNRRSNAVMPSQTVENPEGKTPKVAKYSIVADEVVVANISKRVGVMTLQAKDFT
jgi:hypothetical protein